jgi:8-amino-7-oxononanoate synthase
VATPPRSGLRGLPGQLKDRLIEEALKRRAVRAQPDAGELRVAEPAPRYEAAAAIPEAWLRFDQHPGYQQLRIIRSGAAQLGIDNPFFRAHDGVAGAATRIEGRPFANFSSYNYLGLCGHPLVDAAAREAIERYGTSVSASRLVSGERPLHRQLERALAEIHGVEDCVVFVSGHATNVSTLATLMGPKDLVVHDALIHNSALQGAALSGAARMSFAHNDPEALDALLAQSRRRFERVLVVLEGVYSMDGDYPDLPRFVEIKRRHKAWLMVDEAHSLGVLGANGLGIGEHFGLAGGDVDIWMGTLSKSLASCGGYVAGERALVEHLKCAAPGFVYSVGMAPPLAAASLAALRLLRAEPERARTLRERGALFLELARAAGVDTGTSAGVSVIPAITGSSIKAARLADALFARDINVQPIVYPAVAERAARLRFFMSSEHTEEQIRTTVAALAQELGRL